ncbi:MAG: hypothetical protein ACT4OP_03925 [Actinomycetota bacterium]
MRIDKAGLAALQFVAAAGDDCALARNAREVAVTDRTLPMEPPVRTGSTIPDHAEIPVHYEPSAGRWLGHSILIHEGHPAAAYALGGHWRIRLGPPVGLTPTGLLVFQPVGMRNVRLTIAHPVSEPVGLHLAASRVGIFRHDGLLQVPSA